MYTTIEQFHSIASRYTNDTDHEIITKIINHDENAFTALYHRYIDFVFSIVKKNVKDIILCEDLCQDIFLKVYCWIRDGKFKFTGSFKVWLFFVSNNMSLQIYREHSYSDFYFTDKIETMTVPHNEVFYGDEYDEYEFVLKLTNSLPKEQRDVINMHYFESKKFKEIALQSGVTINTILGRSRLAILKMRKMSAAI